MKYVPAKLKKLNLIKDSQTKVTYSKFLHNFIDKDNSKHLFIVGEYGTGKTMLCIEIESFFKNENKSYKFFRSKEDFDEIKQLKRWAK